MNPDERSERIWEELRILKNLNRRSSIFRFEHDAKQPDDVVMIFAGKGLIRSSAATDGNPPAGEEPVEIATEHQIQIRMGSDFPESEPDIRWLTPIWHPNLANSGFVELDDLGLVWTTDLSLEIIAERIWDVIRMAHYDLENCTQPNAKDWLENESTFRLPLDPRPLCDREASRQTNIVKYSRITPRTPSVATSDAGESGEVMFIDDDTSPPAASKISVVGDSAGPVDGSVSSTPAERIPDQTKRQVQTSNQRRNDDEDILYVE